MIIENQYGKLFNYDNVISVYKNGNTIYVETTATTDTLGEYSNLEKAGCILKQFKASVQLRLPTFIFPNDE